MSVSVNMNEIVRISRENLHPGRSPNLPKKMVWLMMVTVFVGMIAFFTNAVLGQVARLGYIEGRGRVIDGDSLYVGRTEVRLVGIDAPESHQFCRNSKGKRYFCGRMATRKLQQLLRKGKVVCQSRGYDRYNRILAECWVFGKRNAITNLNEAMVMAGMAAAYTKYSDEYRALESLAKRRRAGIWKGRFHFPWYYRNRDRKSLTNTAVSSITPVGASASQSCPPHRPYCKNIRSCQYACFLLKICNFRRLDGDRDGIPCENVCRRRCP